MKNRHYVGYWFCPKCGAENEIPGWSLTEGSYVSVKLGPQGPYRKVIFQCVRCKDVVFEFGLKEVKLNVRQRKKGR